MNKWKSRDRFAERYEHREETTSVTWVNGVRSGFAKDHFHNQVIRVVTEAGKLGFHVTAGQVDEAEAYQQAVDAAVGSVVTPAETAEFVRGVEWSEREAEELSVQVVERELLPLLGRSEFSGAQVMESGLLSLIAASDVNGGQAMESGLLSLIDGSESHGVQAMKSGLLPLIAGFDLKGIHELQSKVSFRDRVVEKSIANSYGASGRSLLQRYHLQVEMKGLPGGGSLKRTLSTDRAAWALATEEIKRLAMLPRVDCSFAEGLPVVMAPTFAAMVFNPIQNLLIQGTCVSEQLHQSIHIRETAHGPYEIPFDDEGVLTRDKEIYRDGVYQGGSFTSLFSAAERGIEATGNGMRPEYRRLPKTSNLHWVMRAGVNSLKEVLGSMEEALLLEEPVGERIDSYTGLLVADVMQGFYVRNGQIVARLPQIRVVIDPVSIWESPDLKLCQESEYAEAYRMKMPYVLSSEVMFL